MNKRLTLLAAGLFAAALNSHAQNAAAPRETLFRIISVSGDCQITRPTLETPEAATAKMYPLGSLLRLGPGAEMMFNFKGDFSFEFAGPGELLVAAGEGDRLLQVVLLSGTVKTKFVKDANYGDAVIEVPGFTLAPGPECNLAIETVREAGGMTASTITLDRGEARASGPHFSLPVLKSCALRVQAAADRSLTRITGVMGEFLAQVDNHTDLPTEYTVKPNAIINIARRLTPQTGAEIVAVLIINELGVGHESYSFKPGDPSIATKGTLRKPPVADDGSEDGDDAEAPAFHNNTNNNAADSDDGFSFDF